jgi:hypothetical protein
LIAVNGHIGGYASGPHAVDDSAAGKKDVVQEKLDGWTPARMVCPTGTSSQIGPQRASQAAQAVRFNAAAPMRRGNL